MTTVTTPLGVIEGTALAGYERYAGIRYAQAPVGDRRFRPPVPVEPWDGVYDATTFGASAPQPIPPTPSVIGLADRTWDEDCLFLNVYTPKADDGRRPVLVWIHGGAYTMGSGDVYEGGSFCTRGDVVVVSLNYRLGVFGWLGLGHLDADLAGSGNNGLLDQIEALRWVRDNIGAFGGDPDNVTIFGESAGGGSVFALLAAPAADGLYHKAIVQSGAAGFREPRGADALAAQVAAHLGGGDDVLAALRSASADDLLDAQTAAVGVGLEGIGAREELTLDGSGPGLHPVVDGVVVTRRPVEAVAEKGEAGVPLIVGTNLDEGTLFTYFLTAELTDDQAAAALRHSCPDPAIVVKTHQAAATGRPLLVDLFTYGIFRIPSLQVADAQADGGAPVWTYLFTWPTPVMGGLLGATHALEIPFVFRLHDDPQWGPFVGQDPPIGLADSMQDAWMAFARTGDPTCSTVPSWPRYDTDRRPTLELGATIEVVDDPEADIRRAWYGE